MSSSRDIYQRFVQILSFVMVVVYMAMGAVFLLKPDFYPALNGTIRYILGALLVIYAIYRGYRIIKTKNTN